MNGRASAPPAIGCIIGVSTSRKPRAFEELADARDDARARLEHLPRVGIDDEIEIALAVARLDVRQAVPLLGQRQQALGEKRACDDAQIVSSFVFVRNTRPFDADVIAEVEQLEDLEVERAAANRRARRPACARARRTARGSWPCRTPRMPRMRPAVRTTGLVGLERLAGLAAVRGDDRADRCRPVEVIRVRRRRRGATSSSSLAWRCAICSASFDID